MKRYLPKNVTDVCEENREENKRKKVHYTRNILYFHYSMTRRYFHYKLSSSLDKIFDFSRDEPVRSLSVDPTPDCSYLNLNVSICLQGR